MANAKKLTENLLNTYCVATEQAAYLQTDVLTEIIEAIYTTYGTERDNNELQ